MDSSFGIHKFGTVDANGLYWDASVIYDLIGANGGYYFGLGFYPFLHNKLTFTNGEKFLFGRYIIFSPSLGSKRQVCFSVCRLVKHKHFSYVNILEN